LDELTISARNSKTVTVTYPELTKKAGDEYFINFSFRTKKSSDLINKDHELAWGQFRLDYLSSIPKIKTSTEKTSIVVFEDKQDEIQVHSKSDKASWIINKKTGNLSNYKYSDNTLLNNTKLNFWRAPTDNDKNDKNGVKSWSKAGLKITHSKIKNYWIENNSIRLETEIFNQKTLKLFNVILIYRFFPFGVWQLDTQIIPGDSVVSMAKIGYQMFLPEDYEQVNWYGHGPHETYPDRNESGKVGNYISTVSDMFEPYVKPQDFGNRTNIRWIIISNLNNSCGFKLQGTTLMNFSVSSYEDIELEKTKHPVELSPSGFTILNFDYKVKGVGTAACGPSSMEKYVVRAKQEQFVITFTPF